MHRNLEILWTCYLFWAPCSFSGQAAQRPVVGVGLGGAALGALIGGRAGALIIGGMYNSIQIRGSLAIKWTGYLFCAPCSFSGQAAQPVVGLGRGAIRAPGAGVGGRRAAKKARKGRKYSVEVVFGPFWGLDMVIHGFFLLF